jgi:putative phage-type endonuclease
LPKIIVNTANLEHGKWLKLRKEGIGGSDASAVAGVSKYASPYMVFWDKLDAFPQEKPEHVVEAAYWGNVHEPVIRKEFTKRVNKEREEQGLPPLKVIHRQAIFAHDEHDFIRTNLDGWITGHEKGKGIFEAKTAHYMLRDDWEGEDVPNAYLIQCQHNMLVMDAQFCYLAVLIGGNTFKYYFIERDEELIQYLLDIEINFWNNHILTRIPPEMTGLEAEKDMLKTIYPDSNDMDDTFTNLPLECVEYVEKVDVAKQLIEELKKEKTKFENEIKAFMGDVEVGYAGIHKVTWKTSKDGKRPLKYKLNDLENRNKLFDKRRIILQKEKDSVHKIIQKGVFS